jgi:hypothetical protein
MHSETGWLSICTIDVIRECGSFIVAVLAEDVICEDVIQFAFEFYMYQIAVDLRVFVFETETIFSTFQFVPLNVDCPFFHHMYSEHACGNYFGMSRFGIFIFATVPNSE